MVILKTILNSFQILEISFQKMIEFATKKFNFFLQMCKILQKKEKDYSCPTFGKF
jgi:hypothetical protein